MYDDEEYEDMSYGDQMFAQGYNMEQEDDENYEGDDYYGDKARAQEQARQREYMRNTVPRVQRTSNTQESDKAIITTGCLMVIAVSIMMLVFLSECGVI